MKTLCQIITLSGLLLSSLLVTASLFQWIRFDITLAYSLFTFAGVLEICRSQYSLGGSRPRQLPTLAASASAHKTTSLRPAA